jgi:hypothetical protein
MHAHKRAAKITVPSWDSWSVTGRMVRVKHVANTRRVTLAPEVRMHVVKDGARFMDTLRAVVGKRVTYKSLTGKLLPATT